MADSPDVVFRAGDEMRSRQSDVVERIIHVGAPRTVTRHAILLSYLLFRLHGGMKANASVVATACLLCAVKERSCTQYCHAVVKNGISSAAVPVSITDVVALELFIIEHVRVKIVIIEACLRVALRHLVLKNAALSPHKEDIARLALSLTDDIYRCDLCLFVESSAYASLLVACHLLQILDARSIALDSFPSQTQEVVDVLLSKYA